MPHFRNYQLVKRSCTVDEVQQADAVIQECAKNLRELAKDALAKISIDKPDPTGLNLEPLAERVRLFDQHASPEEVPELFNEQPGFTFKDFVVKTLGEKLSKMKDAAHLKRLLSLENFDVLAKTIQVAAAIHHFFPEISACDTKVIDECVKNCVDQAEQALRSMDTQSLNTQLGVLDAIERHFPNYRKKEAVVRCIEKQWQPMKNEIEAANNPAAAVQPLKNLRMLARNAAHLKPIVDGLIRSTLSGLQANFGPAGFNQLGRILSKDADACRIVDEHPQFALMKKVMMHDRVTELGKLPIDRLVQECHGVKDPAVVTDTVSRLEKRLTELVEDIYLGSGKKLDEVMDAMKDDVVKTANAFISTSNSSDAGLEFLAHLCAAFAVTYSGEAYLQADVKDQVSVLVKPHSTQLLALVMLLKLHTAEWGAWRTVKGWFNVKRKEVESQILQILTGEGKSIILGILAAFLGMVGITSDIVCYSPYLSERDRNDLLPYYQFLGVASMVNYCTFEQLVSQKLGGFQNSVLEMVVGNATPKQPAVFTGRRMLLIDEIDVFFSRSFFGKTFDAGIELRSKNVAALVRSIFDGWKKNGVSSFDVANSDPFKKAVSDFPEKLRPAILAATKQLLSNVTTYTKHGSEVDHVNKKIGYPAQDGINWTAGYPNETVLLKLHHFPDIDESELFLNLYCGQFSYAEIPQEGYMGILGVTGTLEATKSEPGCPEIMQMYGIRKSDLYVPSVYGKRNLKFAPSEHVGLSSDELMWIKNIQGLIKERRNSKDAILVFFKNNQMLELFRASWPDAHEVLTRATAVDRKQRIVDTATDPQQVTFLTRPFGRGVDFKQQPGTQVVVIQTFFSSTLAEEVQIQGRTARQGHHGVYMLQLCRDHLKVKFDVSDADLDPIQADGAKILELLHVKRIAKMMKKSADRDLRYTTAQLRHKRGMEFLNIVYDPSPTVAAKVQQLSLCTTSVLTKNNHFCVILDASASMQCHWKTLSDSFQAYVAHIRNQNQVNGVESTMTVIQFSSAGYLIHPRKSVNQIPDCGPQHSGYTSFSSGFQLCLADLDAHPNDGTAISILFFTDGAPSDKKEQYIPVVQQLVQKHSGMITKFNCIGFGSGIDAQSLRDLCHEFEQVSVRTAIGTCQQSKDSLVEQLIGTTGAGPIYT